MQGHKPSLSLMFNLQPLAHCRAVASLSLCHRYYFGLCTSELASSAPIPSASSAYPALRVLTILTRGVVSLFQSFSFPESPSRKTLSFASFPIQLKSMSFYLEQNQQTDFYVNVPRNLLYDNTSLFTYYATNYYICKKK